MHNNENIQYPFICECRNIVIVLITYNANCTQDDAVYFVSVAIFRC